MEASAVFPKGLDGEEVIQHQYAADLLVKKVLTTQVRASEVKGFCPGEEFPRMMARRSLHVPIKAPKECMILLSSL